MKKMGNDHSTGQLIVLLLSRLLGFFWLCCSEFYADQPEYANEHIWLVLIFGVGFALFTDDQLP